MRGVAWAVLVGAVVVTLAGCAVAELTRRGDDCERWLAPWLGYADARSRLVEEMRCREERSLDGAMGGS